MRRRLTATITALALALTVFAVPVNAASATKISRVGDKNKTVKVGQEFELKVKKSKGLSDNSIKWTSSNTKVVKYDDKDRYDNDMDFKAVKKGKATITAKNLKTGKTVSYYVTVKANSGSVNISRVGNATKYVEVDDDIDIKVKKGSGLKNSQIKWTISNTKLLKFEDGDNYGASVEIESRNKTGTAKVTAHNLKNGKKIVYTVKIVPEDDD